MGRQVWGTFSVRDHLEPSAFVAEVMLYDRLVIPVPPDGAERTRWRNAGWDPDHLDRLLAILGDRAYALEWNEDRQARWKTKYEGGEEIAMATGDWAFAATRTVLTQDLPRHVTGIQTVTSYTRLSQLESDLQLRRASGAELPLYGGSAVAIIGHEFLVPNDPRWSHVDLLKEAVELSSEPAFARKRAGFWRWQREFLSDKGITDQTAIRDAVEEMRDLLEEEKALARKRWVHTGVQFAFAVGSVTLGLLAAPLAPIAVGGAFLSIATFVADKLLAEPNNDEGKPVSLLRDVRKHFDWA